MQGHRDTQGQETVTVGLAWAQLHGNLGSHGLGAQTGTQHGDLYMEALPFHGAS